MTATPDASLDGSLAALLRYYHDCVAAQAHWSRAINVVNQKDVTLLGLTLPQLKSLGEQGRLSIDSQAARELAKRSSTAGADASLSLGVLFLCGQLPPRNDGAPRRICAPLLETPMSVRLDLTQGAAVVQAEEQELTINYGLIGELLGDGDDQEGLAQRLAELAELTPDFPIDDQEFDTFFNGFLAAADELPISNSLPLPRGKRRHSQRPSHAEGDVKMRGFYLPRLRAGSPRSRAAGDGGSEGGREGERATSEERAVASIGGPNGRGELRLLPAGALVLGRRAGPALNVLGELAEAASRPAEQLAQTALARLLRLDSPEPAASPTSRPPGDEQSESNREAPLSLPLTDTQQAVVRSARTEPLTVVTGPPGTGKSYTITAIVLDALRSGRTVLVASQMDKAVEVVAERVEQLAGPSSIAQSGGRAAQRALAVKLKQLTGPRAEPPPDDQATQRARDAVADLQQQLDQIHQRFDEVVRREREWSRLYNASVRLEPVCPLPIHDLTDRQVTRAESALRRAARSGDPDAGWLTRWWAARQLRRARRALKTPDDWDCDPQELGELLEVQQLRRRRTDLQRRLPSRFPADGLWQQALQLQQRLDEAVLDLVRIERRRQLAEAVADDSRRAQMRQLATLLRRRRRDLKRQLRAGLDPQALLWGFPVWACTNRSLGDILPAEPLFDLAVIDEASQCDPATAAAALLRARRAVIVGDPNQLRHVCFLSRAREQAAVARCQLPAAAHQRFHFRRSLFDIAADTAAQRHFYLLNEHFRSHPQIIEFSNREFYAGELRVMTRRPSSNPQQAVRTVWVDGRRREGSSVNDAEIEAVLGRLRVAIDSAAPHGPPTLGVVSPFRDHVDALRERIVQEFTAEQLQRHRVVVGTAHALQGDEKDVVVLSTSIDPQSHPASLRFLESPNLFNVAVTRARHLLEVVTSADWESLPAGLLRSFLEHAGRPWLSRPAEHGRLEDALLAEVRDRLVEQGLEVWPRFQAAGEQVDVAVADGDRHAAVLLDHERAQGDPLKTHRRLARAGWQVRRLPHRAWVDDWHACVERLRENDA